MVVGFWAKVVSRRGLQVEEGREEAGHHGAKTEASERSNQGSNFEQMELLQMR